MQRIPFYNKRLRFSRDITLKIQKLIHSNARYNHYCYSDRGISDRFRIYGKFIGFPTDNISLRRTGQYYDIVNGLENAGLMIDFRKYLLTLSIHRISQNYIEGQNMIYEGNIFKIDRIDPFKGELTVRLASGGNNDEAVSYIQDREYIAYLSDEEVTVQSSKHIIVKNTPEEKTVSVSEIFIDVITFPMEVVTKGYYLIDPNTMAPDYKHGKYVNIFEGLNERICKQVYRKYGYIE